jgi:hypothetical protein
MLEELIFITYLISLLKNQITGNPTVSVVYIFFFLNFQQRSYWEEDLQSVFHIDNNGQSQENGVSVPAQSFHGW